MLVYKIKHPGENIHLGLGLATTWRVFFWTNYYKVKNVTYHCDSIEQSKYMWEAYRYFFKVIIEPNFVQIVGKTIYTYPGPDADWLTLIRKYLIQPSKKKEYICYSIKPIHNHLRKALVKDCIDLGDSRNFINAQHIIDKVSLLSTADFYIGSSCSWNTIAPIFKTHAYIIKQRKTDLIHS